MQWDEVQAKSLGGGAGCQADVGLPRHHTICSCQMTVGDAIVSLDLLRVHSASFQKFIQQCAASRARLSVHKLDVLPREVLNFAHMLRIPGRDDQPFLPLRKRNNTELLARKLFANE